MKHSYLIIDDDPESILKTKAVAARFQNLHFLASATNYENGLDLILAHKPSLIFLEIDPKDISSRLSFQLINEIYRYLNVIPKIIITTNSSSFAYDAMQYEVLDYFIKPIEINLLRKTILKLEKALVSIPTSVRLDEILEDNPSPIFPLDNKINEQAVFEEPVLKVIVNEIPVNQVEILSEETNLTIPIENLTTENSEEALQTEVIPDSKPIVDNNKKTYTEEKPLIICVKSYGDYRFIEAKDICYLQADNNSTDIHLFNGEMITAFKTLKHFEGVLQSPFVRIHNSYIVNIDYVSRIHTGNSVCYIKNTTTKLPFSKSYKENVDAIINSITKGNYIEI